jgi:hypothetical protein
VRTEARAKAKAKRSAAEIDIDKHVADAEVRPRRRTERSILSQRSQRTSKEDGATGDAPESGEEDLMTDSEEEDGNDYEGNYFDNGEEDSGGDDEAGDGASIVAGLAWFRSQYAYRGRHGLGSAAPTARTSTSTVYFARTHLLPLTSHLCRPPVHGIE